MQVQKNFNKRAVRSQSTYLDGTGNITIAQTVEGRIFGGFTVSVDRDGLVRYEESYTVYEFESWDEGVEWLESLNGRSSDIEMYDVFCIKDAFYTCGGDIGSLSDVYEDDIDLSATNPQDALDQASAFQESHDKIAYSIVLAGDASKYDFDNAPVYVDSIYRFDVEENDWVLFDMDEFK